MTPSAGKLSLDKETGMSHEIEDVHYQATERKDAEKLGAPEASKEYKVTFPLIMTMVGFSLSFSVAEVIPLFLITLFTVIAIDLGDVNKDIWLLVAQIIAIGSIAPFVGTLTDLLGRKGITLLGLLLTMASMALLGTAPNLTNALIAQVIGGISIGIQLLTAIAAVTELVPTYKRGITIGYVVCGFLPFAMAPLYGQLLAEITWRWVTLIVGIAAMAAFLVLAIFYHPPPRPNAQGLTKWQLVRRMDILGASLGISGITIFLVGVNWGGQAYPWHSLRVGIMLTVGLALMIIFLLYECFVAPYPLFPGSLVKRSPRAFAAISFLCLTSGVNYVPLVVFWTVQCYTVYGASFPQAGIYDLPIGFCIAGGAILSAIAITVFRKRIPLVLMVGCMVQTVGLGCMAAVDPNDISTAWAPVVFGLIGVGSVLLPSQVIFSIITPHEIIGAGVALSITIRTIGQVVGVSLFYNLLHQKLTQNAYDDIAYDAVVAGFTDIPSIVKLVTVLSAGPLKRYTYLFPQIEWTPEKIESLQKAGHVLYASAFPRMYLVAIAFGSSAIVACAFLIDVNRFMDEHVAVHLV